MGNRVDLKQVAQPYVGSVEDFYGALFPARTTAQLAASLIRSTRLKSTLVAWYSTRR